jgi:hypothetical protein
MGGVYSFLKDIWDLVTAVIKGITRSDADAPITWIETILGSLFGPMGHIYLRIINLNGALDKKWLFIPGSYIFLGDIPIIGSLIVLIPLLGEMLYFLPTSLFTTLLMRGGYIDIGKGAPVYDWWLLLPIAFKFLFAFILIIIRKKIQSSNLLFFSQIASLILEFGIILIPNVIRVVNDCNLGPIGLDMFAKLSKPQWNKVLMDSFLLLGSSYAFPVILKPYTDKIKFINRAGYEMTSTITWSIGYTCMYVLLNSINQTDLNQYCNDPDYFINNITNTTGDSSWDQFTNKLTLYNIFVVMSLCAIIYKLYDYYEYDTIHRPNKRIYRYRQEPEIEMVSPQESYQYNDEDEDDEYNNNKQYDDYLE